MEMVSRARPYEGPAPHDAADRILFDVPDTERVEWFDEVEGGYLHRRPGAERERSSGGSEPASETCIH